MKSCKNAAFENKMFLGRRGNMFCSGSFRPDWNLALVFLLFLALRGVHCQTELWKWAKHHTQKSNNWAPSSAKWWHDSPLVVLRVTRPLSPDCQADWTSPCEVQMCCSHVHIAFIIFTAYKRLGVCLFVCLFISFKRIFNHSRFFHFLQETLKDKSESMSNDRKN